MPTDPATTPVIISVRFFRLTDGSIVGDGDEGSLSGG